MFQQEIIAPVMPQKVKRTQPRKLASAWKLQNVASNITWWQKVIAGSNLDAPKIISNYQFSSVAPSDAKLVDGPRTSEATLAIRIR